VYKLAFRLFKLIPAEPAHRLVFAGLRAFMAPTAVRRLARRVLAPSHPSLEVEAFGLRFPGPLGLAAGFDKNAEGPDALTALGFGFIEIGTVTAQAQAGNPKPRLFRLPDDRALVNRMGFNNLGAPALASRLAKRKSTIPVGANIGKAKVTPNEEAANDYARALADVWAHVDYVTLNVSSPNTPGLRDLQAVESLAPLIQRVLEENQRLAGVHGKKGRPILLKISPDLADEDLDRVADLAMNEGLDGLIATNTTLSRAGLTKAPTIAGGLSGRPLRGRAQACTERLRARVGSRLPIVGVGGLESGDDVYARLRGGASLVQVYTALIYAGPALLREVTARLLANLARDGYVDVTRAIRANDRGVGAI